MDSEILFISRNYPPMTGGLEIYSYQLIRSFSIEHRVVAIVLGKDRRHLTWFIPAAFLKALWMQASRRRTPVHLCDGLLAPVGLMLKVLTGTRVTATLHGLDVTYANPLYQKLILSCLAHLDRLICVSRATRQEAVARGVPTAKCVVISNGVHQSEIFDPALAAKGRLLLSRRIGRDLTDRRILLTLGRLVKRKGVSWFIENVIPALDPAWIYLVAGQGPEASRILSAIENKGLRERVVLLGRVSDEDRRLLLNSADLFVMPNLRVEGDMEGFGIAAIEAGSCGVPVVASDLEGLKDAVVNGVTGRLVKSGDRKAFLEAVEIGRFPEPENIRKAVAERYGWENIFRLYRQVLLPSKTC